MKVQKKSPVALCAFGIVVFSFSTANAATLNSSATGISNGDTVYVNGTVTLNSTGLSNLKSKSNITVTGSGTVNGGSSQKNLIFTNNNVNWKPSYTKNLQIEFKGSGASQCGVTLGAVTTSGTPLSGGKGSKLIRYTAGGDGTSSNCQGGSSHSNGIRLFNANDSSPYFNNCDSAGSTRLIGAGLANNGATTRFYGCNATRSGSSTEDHGNYLLDQTSKSETKLESSSTTGFSASESGNGVKVKQCDGSTISSFVANSSGFMTRDGSTTNDCKNILMKYGNSKGGKISINHAQVAPTGVRVYQVSTSKCYLSGNISASKFNASNHGGSGGVSSSITLTGSTSGINRF